MSEHRDRIAGTVRVAVARLEPHPKNWRTHGEHQREALRGSLDDLGVSRSLTGVPADPKEQAKLRRLKTREAREKWCREFEKSDGRVLLLDGHLRREEVRSKLVPVELLDLDAREQAELLATLDPIGALANADTAVFLDLARDFSSTDPAVQKLVADVAAMNARGGEHVDLGLGSGGGGEVGEGSGGGGVALPGDNVEEGEPVIPTDALVDKWKTAPGQLWVVPSLTVPGREHRILCGDSTLAEDLTHLLDGASIDMVLTDPPYAIYGSSTGIGADIADDKMVRPFFESVFRACKFALKEFGHCYVCCDWRSWAAVWDSANRAAMSPKNCIVWNKGNGLGFNYANTHEFVGYFAKVPPPKAMKHGVQTGQRGILRPNVIDCNRASGDDRQHNAAKPRPLFEELITNSSDAGESVLDLFGGSGTTSVCAESLGRVSYTMEIEPKNIAIILERLSARGLSPHLVGEGA